MGAKNYFKIVPEYYRISLRFLQLDGICIRHIAIAFL
jgi:hypothetical protein